MRYATFHIDKVEDINKFLEENKNGISRDGVNYVKENICFLFLEGTQEDQIREQLEVGVYDAISRFYKDIADTVAETALWKTKVARGEKGENKIRELEEHAVRARRNLIEAYRFLESVRDGSFMKDAVDESKLDLPILPPMKVSDPEKGDKKKNKQ